MGGSATFSGTSHQAGVIAFVYAHMLAEARLDWLRPSDDTPLAVEAETGGAGDDLRIEFGRAQSVEVQAKHGLKGTLVTSSPKAGPVDRFGVRVRQRGGRTHAEEPIYG